LRSRPRLRLPRAGSKNGHGQGKDQEIALVPIGREFGPRQALPSKPAVAAGRAAVPAPLTGERGYTKLLRRTLPGPAAAAWGACAEKSGATRSLRSLTPG
jgi:hypothetical protein